MLVKTRLIILHIDFDHGTHKCLLDDNGDLPFKDVLEFEQPIQCGPSILKEYLEIDTDWVSFYLVDIMVEENTLYSYYTCMVPSTLKNFKGQWIEIGKIDDDRGHVKKMVYQAGQKLYTKL